MNAILPLIFGALSATAAPTTPLRAPDGPLVAFWQPTANPMKPYIAQIWTPTAKPLPLLEDSPADHVHHHGLMLALGGDNTEFWAETGDPKTLGTQQPVTSTPNPQGDGFTQTLRWIAADGAVLLEETRTVKVRATGEVAKGDAVHWLDWQSILTPAAGRESVKLWGRHYFGLGLRLEPQWANKGVFLWPNTKGQTTVRGDERLTPGPWCAVSNNPGGQPLTVLMLSHPDNPRPGAWFTMSRPFCYLAATYDLEKNPAVLKQGERWVLRHSLAVLSKPVDASAAGRLAADWSSSLSRLFPKLTESPKP